ncbi:Uncharacterised protein [Mycoplasmopsis bovigenitalium]|uniref:Uncharacterized protein n=2 Tax=Mycoplasmopsis bovigenitalium TaxID=2112 RepID=N9V484_9BACT|nr:hypothetical protein [Mycoplasmopsis bovigenitalium]ENY70147.1 Hypothetical protein MBVG_1420 [Mycoplasmopsis bovigenitalium 51080]VEU60716.1 Uncharacterised protein [Mycoplasmopsis bovigenitalium]
MIEIILGNYQNIKQAICNFELELDDAWEKGANEVEVKFIDNEDNELYHQVIKYLDEHSDEFGYKIIKKAEKIIVSFVI